MSKSNINTTRAVACAHPETQIACHVNGERGWVRLRFNPSNESNDHAVAGFTATFTCPTGHKSRL